MPSRRRLVVLFGGRSAEHDVSCVSARHVLAAADTTRYEIIPVGIDRNGRWSMAETAVDALATNTLRPTGPHRPDLGPTPPPR